jgi:hypothetical protein
MDGDPITPLMFFLKRIDNGKTIKDFDMTWMNICRSSWISYFISNGS